jgi:hypothetical protein
MGAEGWSLGDELVALLRRWYVVSAAALLGALAGWLAAYLAPPLYEAEALLSVSFTADAFFVNPDDYKHQQLAELEDFIRTDAVLVDTLARAEPPSTLAPRELLGMLDPRWRNAGSWQLVVTAADPDEAAALARAWREAALSATADALAHAAAFNELDRRLTARARELEGAAAELEAVALLLRDVRAWLADPEALGGEAAGVLLARRTAPLLSGSGTSPESDPLETGPEDWLETAAAALAAEMDVQERGLAILHMEYEDLGDDWLEEQRLSHGLSAYLLVELPENREISVERLYANAPLSLAGAAVGALGYFGYRLVAVLRREEDDRRPD